MRKIWVLALASVFVSASLAQEVSPAPDPVTPRASPIASEAPPAEAPRPPAASGPMPRPDGLRRTDRVEPRWTVRAVPDGSTLALAGGAGRVASLAAFCLGGAPWLALELAPAPDAPSLRAGFGFSDAQVEVEALREEGAGGAYMVELAESRLAGLLAGNDAQTILAIDGTQQGIVSLAGSSAALREALQACHEF